jgi:hypothetical protein
MEANREIIYDKLDDIFLSSQRSLEIAKLFLTYIFIGWSRSCEEDDKAVRKFLVYDFYKILCNKQTGYFNELQDYSKNSDYYNNLQIKINRTNEIALLSQKKEYHDEIIYLMKILS